MRADGTTFRHAPDVRREGGGRRYMIFVYLGLHAGAGTLFWLEIELTDAVLCLALLLGRRFCLSAGYHRLLAHKSYQASRVFRFLLTAGGCASLRGGPLWWAALHRHHHRYSDTETDTFTP